ncbi:MAG: DNA primase [Methylocystaceae bacterium]
MKWNDEIISQIEDRIDIVDLVSETTELKRKGGRYWGLCPFHQEKTPSFSVDRERSLYYCFGCHAGGNIFTFVTNTRGLTYSEAVEVLAERAGVELLMGSSRRQDRDLKKRLLEINELACSFFEKLLTAPEGAAAREYAEKRGIDAQFSQNFRLGYAPDDWNRLGDYLLNQGVDASLLKQSGLVKKAATGDRYFDLFRNRLIFPILDQRGQIIAFGARALGDDQPKYLNSPETEMFSKRRHLFGLAAAREEIHHQDQAILVEGYMDCLKLHQHGISTAVASLGTSFTEEQAHLLSRYTNRVLVLYDGDEAGQRETLRALDILAENGLAAEVVTLVGAKDPDEYLEKYGEKEFLAFIKNNKQSPVEFKLRRAVSAYGTGSWQQQAKVLREVYVDINRQSTELGQEECLQLASRYVGLPEPMVRRDFLSWQRRQSGLSGNSRNKTVLLRDNKEGKDYQRVESLLAWLLAHPAALVQTCHQLGTSWVKDDALRQLLEAAFTLVNDPDGDLDDLGHCLEDQTQQAAYARLMLQEKKISEPEAQIIISEIAKKRREMRLHNLSRELYQLEEKGDFSSMLTYILKMEAHLRMTRKGG